MRTRRGRVRVNRPKTLLKLILCFALGLFVMWSRRCAWPRAIKVLVTLIFILLIVCIALPQLAPPDRPVGGIKLVGAQPQENAFGPEAGTNALSRDVYNASAQSAVITESPSVDNTMVYCNPGGKYYHAKSCKYVSATTGLMGIQAAMDVGYSKCADCSVYAESAQ
jgi:hypothetical protein